MTASEENVVLEAARALGIGPPAFGRLMQLAEQLWREYLIATGHKPGGEHTTGPCAVFMVPCQCRAPDPVLDKNGHCAWCCGAGRVTQHVRAVQSALADWEWSGLARDARKGDTSSAADAFATIARVEEGARCG